MAVLTSAKKQPAHSCSQIIPQDVMAAQGCFFSSAWLIEKPYFQDHDMKDTEHIEIVLGRKNPWSHIVTLYTCAERFHSLSWVVSPTFISLLHTVRQDLWTEEKSDLLWDIGFELRGYYPPHIFMLCTGNFDKIGNRNRANYSGLLWSCNIFEDPSNESANRMPQPVDC